MTGVKGDSPMGRGHGWHRSDDGVRFVFTEDGGGFFARGNKEYLGRVRPDEVEEMLTPRAADEGDEQEEGE